MDNFDDAIHRAHIRQYRRAHRFTGGLVLACVALGMALAVWVLTMGGV